jgi:elongation factor G
MKSTTVSDTRNFALVGHSGDGKTSLGEALLHVAGEKATLGKVDDGTSSLNYLPEEKKRTTTISSSIYGFDWSGKHMTLVDTPGDSNFQADGQIAVSALDGAVLVVNAVGGAKVGTERMYRHCAALGLPTLTFVNGLDRERADFEGAFDSLRKMGANPVVLTLPIGGEAALSGVVDLLTMKAFGPDGEREIPSERQAETDEARRRLVEAVAEGDDELLEKYLEEGALSAEEVTQGLVAGVRARRLVPVLCGSATTLAGVQPLLRHIAELLPSPADRDPWPASCVADGSETEVTADPAAPFSALVLKTLIDRYAGTLSAFRVVSGTLQHDSVLLDATTGSKERVSKLMLLQGDEHVDVPEAGPGDVVAVAKLKDVHTGNALTAEKGGVALRPIAIPQGVISYAIQAKSKGDEDKVYTSLGRLVEEDPTLQLGREASTGEFLLTGMGELHVRITVQKLQRMFGVDVELKTPKVPYRETITRRAEHVEGKLKKQTGGKGMFGVCYLTVEPKPRGEGIEFVDEVRGGAIPRGLIPAVEKGIHEACLAGPIAGYPVVDVRVRCVDGKHHSVDSNEMAFKLAGSFGFKAAVEKAGASLLEPIMDVDISAPGDFVGDIMGDISSRRGRVQSSEAKGATQVIRAQVPMAEMLEYASREGRGHRPGRPQRERLEQERVEAESDRAAEDPSDAVAPGGTLLAGGRPARSPPDGSPGCAPAASDRPGDGAVRPAPRPRPGSQGHRARQSRVAARHGVRGRADRPCPPRRARSPGPRLPGGPEPPREDRAQPGVRRRHHRVPGRAAVQADRGHHLQQPGAHAARTRDRRCPRLQPADRPRRHRPDPVVRRRSGRRARRRRGGQGGDQRLGSRGGAARHPG